MYPTNIVHHLLPKKIVQKFRLGIFLFLLLITPAAAQTGDKSESFWTDLTAETKASFNRANSDENDLRFYLSDDGYRSFRLDESSLDLFLRQNAPPETAQDVKNSEAILALPLPESGFARFRIVESPLMEADLAAKFPDIKTYLGQGIDDPTATLRFSLTKRGFEAQILASGRSVFIEPVKLFDNLYVSYNGASRFSGDKHFDCQFVNPEIEKFSMFQNAAETNTTGGAARRDYIIAVAATGEYTQDNGGTVGSGLAAVTATMTRVNGIFEREINIRLILSGNNNLLIYTNPATDPYTDNGNSDNRQIMIGENQTNLDTVIGSANYDIGHLFARAGGGWALFETCRNQSKARAVTGKDSPYSYTDAIYAHEIAHQFRASHSFSATTGACGNAGQLSPSSAYEFGSGSTIMAYTGFCFPFDTQAFRDEYFHNVNLNQMDDFIGDPSGGDACSTIVPTGNAIPTVNAGNDYFIPILTPFTLSGTATDPNGDALTYAWEQYNLGTTDQTRPLFRGYYPLFNGNTRTFPQMQFILNNNNIPPPTYNCPQNQNNPNCTYGEQLPAVARTMNFRLTARDNRASGGSTDHDDMQITVVDTGAPFKVLTPAAGNVWNSGQTQSISWDSAGTNSAPINAANVKIYLSTDDGGSFTLLKDNTPNDGFESIYIPPQTSTTNARIMIQAANNIFFDVSESFTLNSRATYNVTGHVRRDDSVSVSGAVITANPSGITATTNSFGDFSIALPDNTAYTLTVSYQDWTFSPASQSVPTLTGNFALPQPFVGTPAPKNFVWTGGGYPNQDWDNPANWSEPGFPGVYDYVTVGTGAVINLGNTTRTVKKMTLTAGTLQGGNLTVTEEMNWSSNNVVGAYLDGVNLTIPQTSVLNLRGGILKGFFGGTLTNRGTVSWTGDYFNFNGSQNGGTQLCRFDNEGVVRLEAATDYQIFLNGGENCSFNNKTGATVQKPSTANNAPNIIFQQTAYTVDIKLNNEGKIKTDAGRLIIYGSAEFKTGTRFEGAGVTLLQNALKKFTGQIVIADGATLETGYGGTGSGAFVEGVSAGSVNTEGTGTFLVGSGTTFDGVINLHGKTDIDVTTNLLNPGVSLENGNNGADTVNNYGTINWRGNEISLGSSVFHNRPNAVFNILCDNIFNSQGTAANGSTFTNHANAVIRKSNSGGATDFMNYPFLSQFHNHGLVDVQSGTMFIHNGTSSGGTFRTAQNTVIEIQQNELYTFLNTNFETNGTFRNNGGFMNGSFRGTLQMLSGAVVNNLTALQPTQTLAPGIFDWRGGTISSNNQFPNPVNVVIQPNAAMFINAADAMTWSGAFCNATVTNNGDVQWTGQPNTNISVGGCTNGLTFNNNGRFFLESDGVLFRHSDNSTFVFNNNASGLFKKSGGNGSTQLDIFWHKFNNFGTIEIASGKIESGGVEFEFKNNSRIKSGGGRLALVGASGTSEANGAVTLEGAGAGDNYVLELGGASNGVTLEGNGLTLRSENNAGFLWTSGTMRGNILLGAGLRTKIQPSGTNGNVTLDGSLSNAGIFEWEGAMNIHIGGVSSLTNLAGGIFNARSTGAMYNESGSTMAFINAGTLNIGQTTGAFNLLAYGAGSAVNFTNQTSGTVNIEIGGANDFDKIATANALNFGGRLNVGFVNNYAPNVGDEFKIFDGDTNGANLQGAFAQVSLPSVNGKSLRLVYNSRDLTLQTDALYVWTGAASTDWNNPANWQGNQVPPPNALVEIPDSGVMNQPDLGGATVTNLTVENGQNVSVGDGETLTVNGVLNLEGGTINTGGNALRNHGGTNGGMLVVGANGAINRTSGYVVGAMKKIFSLPGGFTFPVGTAGGYSPLDAEVTAGSGDLTVEAESGVHPNANQSHTISRFWSLQGAGLTANLTFNYTDGDVIGSENFFQLMKASGGTAVFYPHNPPNVLIDTANNRAKILNVSSFSDWTLSANLIPTAAAATVSGRVSDENGNGVARASMTLSGGNLSAPRRVKTNAFGYFVFEDVPTGATYILTVGHKRYVFSPDSRVINLIEDVSDIDFIGGQ